MSKPKSAEENIARSYAVFYLGIPLFSFGFGGLLAIGKMYFIPNLFNLSLLQSMFGVGSLLTLGYLTSKRYGVTQQALGISILGIPIGAGYIACSMLGLNKYSALLTSGSFLGVVASFFI